MTTLYTINVNGDILQFIPQNYDSVKITFKSDDKPGSWQLLYSINEIELIGSDYQWLYNKMIDNKCQPCYLKVNCDDKEYNFKFNYYTCSIDIDGCGLSIKSTMYLPNYENLCNGFEEEYDITDGVAGNSIQVFWLGITYPDAKKIHNILDYICARIGCSWTSTFLTNPFPPMPYGLGEFDAPYQNLNLSTINVYSNLYLTQSLSNTDAIQLSLSGLLNALCNHHLNLRWRFNESINTIQIEHYKYFNNSLSYANPAVVGLDATIINGGKWLDETRKYIINDANYYAQERWQLPIKQADVVQAGVNYSFHWRFWYNCAIPTDTINTINTTFETNVHACENIGSSETLLLACDINDMVLDWQVGAGYIYNYPFQSGVIYKFWMWNRPYSKGRRLFNQADFDMESTIKSRTNEITIPICCNNINEYELVKDLVGDGYIDGYSIDMATGMGTFKLKYEDI